MFISISYVCVFCTLPSNGHTSLRGHVNKKKFQKSKKTLEVGGWVKCLIGNKKKLENIFLYIILLRFWASIRTSITL